jgi:hypothetical protein
VSGMERRQSAMTGLAADKTALADREYSEAVLSRARTLIATRPAVEKLRAQAVCSATGVHFPAIVVRKGELVQLVGHEAPGSAGGGVAAALAGSFTFIGAVREWNCPICRVAPGGVEAFCCECPCYADVLHCGARRGSKMIHCACGDFREANFVAAPAPPVLGHIATMQRSAARPLLRRRPALLPRCLR